MAYGRWGSRVPVGNLFFSTVVSLGVRWRRGSRRFINSIRSRVRSQPVATGSSLNAADELKRWLQLGYDKLNVGGGPKNLEGFVNVDFVRHANVEREVC